jgi:micrococcal nuclease
LTSANLNEARLPGANLSRSGLVGASLRDACLTPSNLSQSHAEGADFTGAVLNRADVRGTRFEFDLRNARLEKTGLAGIKVDKSTHWPLDFKLREPPTTTLFTSFRTPIPADALTDKAVRFTDGDTLLAEKSGAIRLIGVDAPVLRDRLGRKAVEFMRNTLPEGQTFRYTLGRNRTDAFDRKLAYIWHADGRFVNAALLFLGLAERRENPVNDTYETKFRDAETIAKQIGRNIWNSCPRR